MKTSKKLLSLFLALVMVITSCSVGFTAFAADGNKTDANNTYWNDGTDAKAAFESLNTLTDAYVPQLLNIPAVKKILEDNLGMTVTSKTNISDVIAGASPMVFGLLGGAVDKEAIIAELKGSAYSKLDDYYFSFLDNEEAQVDFYTLYNFCKQNQSADGELGEYARATLPKLQELGGQYNAAAAAFSLKLQAAQDAIGMDYGAYLPSSTDKTKVEVRNIDVNGTPFSECPAGNGQFLIDYINGMFIAYGSPERAENIADAVYFMMMDEGGLQLGLARFLGTALLGGAQIKPMGATTAISWDNYETVLGTVYPFAAFLSDNGMSQADYDSLPADQKAMIQEHYKSTLAGMILSEMFPTGDNSGSVNSPFYEEMCLGLMVFTDSFGDLDACKDLVKSKKITDAQFDTFCKYLKDELHLTGYDKNKIVEYLNNNSPFSDLATKYFLGYITDPGSENLVSGFFEECIDNPAAAKAHILQDTDYNKVYLFKNGKNGSGALTMIERLNAMMASEVLIDKFGTDLQTKGVKARDAAEPCLFTEDFFNYIFGIKPGITKKYEYKGDIKIKDELMVDAVNTTLNALLAKFFDPSDPNYDATIGGIISSVLDGLLETKIELFNHAGTGILNDIWLKLYENPVEELFNLLPTLTILVDELLVPILLNKEGDKYNGFLYDLLCTGDGILAKYTQTAGSDIGLGALNINLNTAIPSILSWLVGKKDAAIALVGTYGGGTYDSSVPKFLNIYVADKAIAGASLNGGLAKVLKNTDTFKGDNAYLADAIDEAVTEIANFALTAVNTYLAQNEGDKRYDSEGTVTQNGLNNVFVALPEVLNIMGQQYVNKYKVDSDWEYTYPGKIETITKNTTGGDVQQKQNNTLQDFKNLATENKPALVLNNFVDILIGNWLNSVLDIVNDTVSDENNKISSNLPLVQGLLDAFGGFGERSVITDVLDGLFQLKRSDKAAFTLTKRAKTSFVGFSNESGFFLISNIQFEKGGKTRGLIPFISTIINPNDSTKAKYKLGNAITATSPKLAGSSKAKKSAAGTEYSKLLSKRNVKAAQKLVDALDTLLSSLLENTSVNGFDLDANDNVLSGVVSFASAYLGYQNTNDIVKLINNYLYYINGEKSTKKSKSGKIGNAPTKAGNVDKKKVYTTANLSNLVIQTYSLVENIIDYLFYNSETGFLTTRDPNMLIADAAYGLISPDAVAVRLSSKYSETAKVLKSKDHHNWNSFKIKMTTANKENGKYQKNYLKFDFAKGDKKAFYKGLGETFSGVAAIIGVLLTDTCVSASQRSTNLYSEILYPVMNKLADATGGSGVMKPADFTKAAASKQLIDGLLAPVSSVLSQLYPAPASFLLNVVKGVAGVLDDGSIKGFINSIVKILKGQAKGVVNVVKFLSPTLAKKLNTVFGDLIGKLVGATSVVPKKDIIVTLLNNISIGKMKLSDVINLKSINWKKLASAKSPAEVLLLVYGYVVDTVLGSELITGLIESFSPGLTKILKKLNAVEILNILADVIASVQSPTEIFWTFKEYAGRITNTFIYPQGILASDASKAVGQLDDLVANVFPLLNALGVTDIEGLAQLVNDKLYTNDLLTKATKGIYGALSKGTLGDILKAVGLDLSPQGIADYLTDKSFGATYTSAAKTLRKAKNWDKVESLNWGFTDGSAKAQRGFINGLAAVLRPLNDLLAVLLAEGSIKDVIDLDVVKIAKMLDLKGKTNLGSGEYGATLDYKLKNGILVIGIRSNVKTADGKPNVRNEIKVDVNAIAKELQAMLDDAKLSFGTNGYESAVIPILEAFMCRGVKTYKTYVKEYKKAKDNLLINVLNPVFNLVNDILDKPFDTVTKILPNVAYFIDSNGVAQAVGNLLAPITGKDGILGVLSKHGLNIDKLIELIFAKDLGTIVTDALDINTKLTIKLTDMSKTNVQVIVLPLINKILKDNDLPITLPEFTFKKIASHGTIAVVKSAARNDQGKFTTRRVISRQGETLVAVLRYVSTVLIRNAYGIKSIICNIDALKDNDKVKNIIGVVFNQIALAVPDDIVRAVFYFLTEQETDKFFDYRNFKYDTSYKFSWGDMDEEFCRKLAPMLDGMIGSLLEGGLAGLVEEKLYTDELVAKLAKGLYGAVEGVKINDDIGSLTNLLAMTDIDFSTGNVASLLMNQRYGLTYPAAATIIQTAGSWENVKAEDLKFGVKDRNSFLNALVAVLRPLFGVLDVILNDAALNLFDLVKLPGSDGYTSTIVPLLEAFGVYNIKTQYQYREDCFRAYDNVLLDIINPLWDKVEDILNAPLQTLMSILPNLSLFFANDGLLQIVDNLLTPVTALLDAIRPIADINKIIDALGVDIPGLLKEKVGLTLEKFDLYDLPGTLKPLVGADNVVGTINSVLGIIKIKDNPLGLELPAIDWFQLASHGKFITNGTSQVAAYGKRIYVKADEDETLIALLRFLINTINYKDNYDQIVKLITGLLGDNVDESLAGTINDVLGMLKGDADSVISDLVELLQQIAG